eukprot:TRINITY_DN25920_c0_g1_i2.p1 TRINITY_DN25920_c0_g1~~TRINITY_DN25920_c0_g1_i2.p1  ORF type:complete len:121 (+),score=32.58 TRINITY_DN25920_c0_g1_i2:69-431(+)
MHNYIVKPHFYFFFFFFFKQKTAYEMLRSLVGSEMCIRDRSLLIHLLTYLRCVHPLTVVPSFIVIHTPIFLIRVQIIPIQQSYSCLLYTSDAADEEDSVDLGGRRIIKKKKNEEKESNGK